MTVTKFTPNWAPAEQYLPDLLDVLMWMGTVDHEGRRIEQYKHYETRRYISLDADGQAWKIRYSAGNYSGVPDVVAPVDMPTARQWLQP